MWRTMAEQTRAQDRRNLRAFLKGSEDAFVSTLNQPEYDDNFQVQSLQAAAQTTAAYALLSLADEVAELRAVIEKGNNDG